MWEGMRALKEGSRERPDEKRKKVRCGSVGKKGSKRDKKEQKGKNPFRFGKEKAGSRMRRAMGVQEKQKKLKKRLSFSGRCSILNKNLPGDPFFGGSAKVKTHVKERAIRHTEERVPRDETP